MRVTRATLKNLIGQCEEVFRDCFNDLQLGFQGELKRLIKFQPDLCRALRRLDSAHYGIAQEKRELVARKGQLHQSYFIQRLRTLSTYSKVLAEAVEVGHALGNAFAWLFYKNEYALMQKHWNHQRQHHHRPSGIGGLGEFEFLLQCPFIEGKLVLYHGITTFLRVGDFSLIHVHPEFSVAHLIEIKTAQTGPDTLLINAFFVGNEKLLFEGALQKPDRADDVESFKLPENIQAKVRKQITSLGNLFERKVYDGHVDIERTSQNDSFQALEGLLEKVRRGEKLAATKADDGLVLLAVRSPRRSWRARLMLPEKIPDFDRSDLFECLRETIDQGQVDNPHENLNELRVWPLGPSVDLIPGAAPFLHWSLSSESLRMVLFGEVVLLSLYNPAHLARRLRELGFQVSAKSRKLQITKKDTDFSLELQGWSFLERMIGQHLVSDSVIIESLTEMMEFAQVNRDKCPSRIDLNIRQMVHRRPSSRDSQKPPLMDP